MMPEELNKMDEVLKSAFEKVATRVERSTNYNFDSGGFTFSALADLAQARVAIHNARQQREDQPEQPVSAPKRPTLVRLEVDGRGGFGNRG